MLIRKNKKLLKKLIAEINSTKKYSKFILVKQCLHLALSIMKESNGILSYQLIFLLQDKQNDRAVKILIFLGILLIQTLLKLPHILPKINAVI